MECKRVMAAPHNPAAPAGEPAGAPVAVSRPVVDLVTGGLRPATVLAVHSAAVVLTCEADDAVRVVTVLTMEASGVPNGVRTTLHAAARPFAHLAPGDPAFVGGGGIRLPGLYFRGVRVLPTTVPTIRPAASAVLAVAAAARAAVRGVADEPVTALHSALDAFDAGALRIAVAGLVGLGSGSTPGGDDVLCGTLAGLHATGRSVLAHQVAVAALQDVAARTPLMSADLLRLAARGHACVEACAVLRACGTAAGPGHDSALERALQHLIAIGHTSGADLATGLALGLAVPPRSAPRPRPRHRAIA